MHRGTRECRERERPNVRLLQAARTLKAAGSLRTPAALLMTRRSRSAMR